eukprot:1169342-Pleurochrysis_carterae.AAC.1
MEADATTGANDQTACMDEVLHVNLFVWEKIAQILGTPNRSEFPNKLKKFLRQEAEDWFLNTFCDMEPTRVVSQLNALASTYVPRRDWWQSTNVYESALLLRQ